ncbi:DUF6625 family protein [Methylobacterium soli]|uniref:Glycosyltransferase family 4 protein n=1 Tax=Methylobacterium soli TaxID=553447 RepID=A0A6L3SVR1_9HYPH|nr:DUF6625 family protein [Methylobacterium soli]KAB1070364.1 glycosyltransferase family 4 protein [Methylobacterium soli]GJE41254.1 D-inositol-3-phosphate glycosyltransferase [Methylobacterium soli]
MASNTLHIIGVAHTVVNRDNLICAFTAKVLLFPEVIQPFGWHVIEYSNEGSESHAHEHVVILTRERLQQLTRRSSREDPHHLDVDNQELGQEYQEILVQKLQARARPGDIVCHVWGPNIGVYDAVKNCHHVELSVGYGASPGLPFRIFESSAWMHYHYGKLGDDQDGSNYRWVIPSAFDDRKWIPSDEFEDYALFHGRVTTRKGINILTEIARRMPDLPVHVYGPGDVSPWLQDKPGNLHFKGSLFGDDRVSVVQRARCILTPTTYIEPFGFSGIEAQLCGVPHIGSSFGAFHETIMDGLTGYRCHTLADWVEAIRWSGRLDRKLIARSARERYSREAVGQQYDWALRQLADLSGPGWYGACSRKFEALAKASEPAQRRSRIWIYVPYFGSLPKYFHLYLESLRRNEQFISVIMLTDIDMTDYQLPPNLICVPMNLSALREKISRFLSVMYGASISPGSLIPDPYKLVDFKILYPELFHTVGAQYGANASDYVGWGDVDVIYGRFSDFLSLDSDYDVIGGFHGHLTAVRNCPSFRSIHTRIPDLLKLLTSDQVQLTDEVAYRKPLLDFLDERQAKMFYINRYFCDVVPERFVHLFRSDVHDSGGCFFDAYHPDRDIKEIRCNRDGRLTVLQTDGSSWETIYCHLQKRNMSLNIENPASEFMIRRDGFYTVEI